MIQNLITIVVVAIMLPAAYAVAESPAVPVFSISGFGTFGMVHSSEHRADFTSTAFKPNGAGYSHDWSADVDSLIAAQLTADFTQNISAVAQVISEQNYDKTYRPHVEWANIKYDFTPDLSVRVGRTVLPSFLFSGTRKVGYTYPWVRPPLELYSQVPLTNNDGLDANYRQQFGELTNNAQIIYGSKDAKLPVGVTIQSKHTWGISDTVDLGAFTAHISYQKFYVNVELVNEIADAFRQFGPQGAAIADRYKTDYRPSSFTSLGASYDPGNWFVMSEGSWFSGPDAIADKTAWYISGGFRFDSFTPFIAYSQARAGKTSDPGLDVTTVPSSLVGLATSLNSVLNALLRSKTVENTISIGGRWDFMKNTDCKLQFDHSDIGSGSTVFTNIQPGFKRGGTANVVSASIDFVF
jgi:hypothetical protein